METTFRTLVEELFSKHISLDKVNEIVNDVYNPKIESTTVVEPTKKESKKETKKEAKSVEKETKKDEKHTNISRFSAEMLKRLKAELVKVGITFTNDKEIEKFKKEFTKNINSMDKETYVSKKLEEHMAEFANTKNPVKEEKPPSEHTNSNVYATVQVTLEELQKNDHLIVVGADGPQHTFWDAPAGRFVVGPDSDDEDDDEVVKKDGKTYYVAKQTGRVYIKADDEEADVFDGYVGVGKYKDLLKK